MPNDERAYTLISVPDRKKVGTPYESDSRRDFTSRKGFDLASLTLPDAMIVQDAEGIEHDVSRFTFVCRTQFVTHDIENGVYTASFPETNGKGESWKIRLSRTTGKYVDGEFVVEGKREVDVEATALRDALAAR